MDSYSVTAHDMTPTKTGLAIRPSLHALVSKALGQLAASQAISQRTWCSLNLLKEQKTFFNFDLTTKLVQ